MSQVITVKQGAGKEQETTFQIWTFAVHKIKITLWPVTRKNCL